MDHVETVPENFLCPMSLGLMADPVATADGKVYEREYIEVWRRICQSKGGPFTSPATGLPLHNTALLPLPALQKAIEFHLRSRPNLSREKFGRQSFEEAMHRLQEEQMPVNVSSADELKWLKSKLSQERARRNVLQSEAEDAKEKLKKLKNRRWVNRYGQFNGAGNWVPGLWQQQLRPVEVADAAVGTSDAEKRGMIFMNVLIFGALLLIVAASDYYFEGLTAYVSSNEEQLKTKSVHIVERLEVEGRAVPSHVHLQERNFVDRNAHVDRSSADDHGYSHMEDVPLVDSSNTDKFLATRAFAEASAELQDLDETAYERVREVDGSSSAKHKAKLAIENVYAERSAELRAEVSASMLMTGLVADLNSYDAVKRTETVTQLVNFFTIHTDAVDLAVEYGAIPSLMDLLSDADEIRSQTAAEAVAHISERRERYRSMVVQAGAIPKLVELLGGSPMQKRSSARALQTIAHGKHVRLLATSEVVEPLVALLKEPYSEDWDMTTQAAMTLFNIVNSGNELFLMKARILISKFGAIEASLFALKRRGFQDPELASWLLKLLGNLVIGNHTNERKLLDSKALALIVSFLTLETDHPLLHNHVIGLLWKLCQDHRAHRLIVKSGARKPLLQMVQDGDEIAKTRAALLLKQLEDRRGIRNQKILV